MATRYLAMRSDGQGDAAPKLFVLHKNQSLVGYLLGFRSGRYRHDRNIQMMRCTAFPLAKAPGLGAGIVPCR